MTPPGAGPGVRRHDPPPSRADFHHGDVIITSFYESREPDFTKAVSIAMERCEPFLVPWAKWCQANRVDMVRTMMASCYLQGFVDARQGAEPKP